MCVWMLLFGVTVFLPATYLTAPVFTNLQNITFNISLQNSLSNSHHQNITFFFINFNKTLQSNSYLPFASTRSDRVPAPFPHTGYQWVKPAIYYYCMKIWQTLIFELLKKFSDSSQPHCTCSKSDMLYEQSCNRLQRARFMTDPATPLTSIFRRGSVSK